eukprot:5106812-Amphidinium_carterae.2
MLVTHNQVSEHALGVEACASNPRPKPRFLRKVATQAHLTSCTSTDRNAIVGVNFELIGELLESGHKAFVAET